MYGCTGFFKQCFCIVAGIILERSRYNDIFSGKSAFAAACTVNTRGYAITEKLFDDFSYLFGSKEIYDAFRNNFADITNRCQFFKCCISYRFKAAEMFGKVSCGLFANVVDPKC